ncbi:uncharacterized protein PGTG_08136 [Puccinia graminis f. sp. tritici CRL 75-36-700-3]|uniref:Uncharacterized protein n=1 Tax=Puccinia graminis f. sp. tritici (strain CRL 75-36-700-3 / race SCCL) TaxID=418459 RepID=E3KCD9_PUCGT|nr:uncharacterized protein PGTG_08136 [Puccinia graminis f. sp. tritici CRL 75-36-700-3]EFP81887.1 hypothetical protein PGTG_08136 [Puccinia graminis f. sp. tritici CRL 75-36-700-3]
MAPAGAAQPMILLDPSPALMSPPAGPVNSIRPGCTLTRHTLAGGPPSHGCGDAMRPQNQHASRPTSHAPYRRLTSARPKCSLQSAWHQHNRCPLRPAYLTTGLLSFSAVGILQNLKSCKTASNNPFSRQRNIPRLAQFILAFNRWSSSTGGYPSAQPASFQRQGVNKGKKRESVLEESSNHSPKRALNNHQSNSPMASTSQGRVNTVEMERMTLGELFVERQLAEAQFDECPQNQSFKHNIKPSGRHYPQGPRQPPSGLFSQPATPWMSQDQAPRTEDILDSHFISLFHNHLMQSDIINPLSAFHTWPLHVFHSI